jgi:hypothetical protein
MAYTKQKKCDYGGNGREDVEDSNTKSRQTLNLLIFL